MSVKARILRKLRGPQVSVDRMGEVEAHVAAIAHHLHLVESDTRDKIDLSRVEARDQIDHVRSELDWATRVEAPVTAAVEQRIEAWASATRDHAERHANEATSTALEPLDERLRRVERSVKAVRQELLRTPAINVPTATASPEGSPEPIPAAATSAVESGELYESLEARFRGGTRQVRALQAEYVELINSWGTTGQILDIGCGRGEFLGLLADAGIEGRGVDTNPTFVTADQADGLTVELADGVELLRALESGSLGGVVAFHVVEHLPAPSLVELLAQAARVIRPGGGIILETPNPENLVVGATTFWLDPTHVRPVPPLLLEFLVQEAGFVEVAIRRLHPSEPLLEPDLVELVPEAYRAATERLVRLVSGPMDYAVVGRVPVD